MNKLDIKKGDKFNKLTVVKEVDRVYLPSGQVNRVFRCICDCGKTKDIRLVHLKRGRISSCGCIKNTMNGKSTTNIGVLYRAMKYRCSKNYFEKHLYYEKGVRVCDEWSKSFEVFESWCKKNGYKKGLQIDRINNDKGYFPDNCRFVTPKVNTNNRSNTFYVEYKGEKKSLRILVDELNVKTKFATIRQRLSNGWSLEDAMFKPTKKLNNKKLKEL